MNTRSSIADRLVGAPATAPPSKPATGTEVVTVACKILQGIVISRYVLEDVAEPNSTGIPRSVKMWKEVEGSGFVIRGPSSTLPPMSPAGIYPMLMTSGGYALTSGVPKDLWDSWLEANRNSDMIKHRLVFCASEESRARDEGRELADTVTGLEPVDVSSADSIRRFMGRERLALASFTGQRPR
jgi:hypothetical protein